MAKPAISDPAEAADVSDSAVAGPASSASSASDAAGSAPSSDPPATEDAAESSPRANARSQVGSAPAHPLMASVPCNPSVWAPVMEVAFSSRFPDEPLFESPLELEEFFRAHSPSPPPSPDAAVERYASSNPGSRQPGFHLRSILKDRSAGDSFPLVEPPQKPTRDDPAMRPVSPASPADPDKSDSACLSPAYSKTNSSLSSCTPSPPRTPVPPGFRPDGLMEARIPSRPSADFRRVRLFRRLGAPFQVTRLPRLLVRHARWPKTSPPQRRWPNCGVFFNVKSALAGTTRRIKLG
ncbi:hypothetical protein PF001_g23328 [Phytophthora fragariae]|uniref:Uncharacterized protein n=1 Tax=Phytophthora fragariae TaxID=53985 RepID=A0A6A4BYI5_9STRA|nr:hypothetical protein PF001_g23328 [Phytophthora fragariae]